MHVIYYWFATAFHTNTPCDTDSHSHTDSRVSTPTYRGMLLQNKLLEFFSSLAVSIHSWFIIFFRAITIYLFLYILFSQCFLFVLLYMIG